MATPTINESNGIETLNPAGMFVWWELDNSRITPDALRQILDDEGFTPKSPVPDIDPASAIRRACSEWSMGRGNQKRYKAEITHEANGFITVGLLTRERVDAKEVEWTQRGIAEFDTASGTWTVVAVDNDSNEKTHTEAMASFRDLTSTYLTFLDHRWIRPNLLTPTMEAVRAVNMRRGSGFYFAPKQHMAELRRLRRVIRRIGNCDLRLAVVGNDEDTVSSVTSATSDEMVSTINDIQEQLRGWADSDRAVRTDSQANALTALAELIKTADVYEAALDVRLDTLRSDIQAARRKALAIIADKAA